MANLGIFLGVLLLFAAAISVYIEETFAEDPAWLLLPFVWVTWSGIFLPGALIYLAWVARVTRELPPWRARSTALALSPVLLVGPGVFLAIFGLPGYAWLFLVPAALAYGALVRLPPRLEPPD